MVDMDDRLTIGPRGPVVFSGLITLGNLLIMMGMFVTGATGIYVVGGHVQKLEDAIQHEAEIRTLTIAQLGEKVDALAKQESADIKTMSSTLSDIRADFRAALSASQPKQK